jgi:hypothetical protein
MVCAAVAAALVALAAGAAPAEADAGPDAAPSQVPLRLAPRLSLDPSVAQRAGVAAVAGGAPGAPVVCPPDWCQPRVDVPGLTSARPSPSRPELAAALLDAAKLEPLADLAWLLARTGLEMQWKPPRVGGGLGTGTGGYGAVIVWLKLRLDAFGRPSFPTRTRVSVPGA